MISESHDLRTRVSTREVTVSFQADPNYARTALSHFMQACGYVVTGLLTRRARLNLIREDADQRGSQPRGEFAMKKGQVDLFALRMTVTKPRTRTQRLRSRSCAIR